MIFKYLDTLIHTNSEFQYWTAAIEVLIMPVNPDTVSPQAKA